MLQWKQVIQLGTVLMNDMVIIIPARSGSKGIKNKNMTKVNSVTLLENTILQALKFTKKENIFVSTDSKIYLESVSHLEINNNGLRPSKLSSDTAKIYDVIKYELDFIKNKSIKLFKNKICYIFEPSFYGLRTNILRSLEIYKKNPKINSIFGAIKVPLKYNYYKQYYFDKDKLQFLGKNPNINRQNLKMTYVRSGEFYSFRIKKFYKENTIFPSDMFILETQKQFANIDEKCDLKKIQLLNIKTEM